MGICYDNTLAVMGGLQRGSVGEKFLPTSKTGSELDGHQTDSGSRAGILPSPPSIL